MKFFDGLALGQFDTLKSQTQHEMMSHSQRTVVRRSDLREDESKNHQIRQRE